MFEQIPGPLSVRECDVLAALASSTKASRALEVGHYLGLSTSVLLQSLPARCELITVDHHQGDEWWAPPAPAPVMDHKGPMKKWRKERVIKKNKQKKV